MLLSKKMVIMQSGFSLRMTWRQRVDHECRFQDYRPLAPRSHGIRCFFAVHHLQAGAHRIRKTGGRSSLYLSGDHRCRGRIRYLRIGNGPAWNDHIPGRPNHLGTGAITSLRPACLRESEGGWRRSHPILQGFRAGDHESRPGRAQAEKPGLGRGLQGGNHGYRAAELPHADVYRRQPIDGHELGKRDFGRFDLA
jgi:hypothetical protein